MKIEHFYYDEQEKWLAQMKAAMEKHDAKLSEEERTLEQKKSDMELQNIIQNAEREEKQTYLPKNKCGFFVNFSFYHTPPVRSYCAISP